jgi:hypothetical protein
MMRSDKIGWNLFGLLFGLVFLISSAWAGQPDNFTAKMVMGEISMPFAKMGNKIRIENPMMEGMVTISLKDAQKVITYSTQTKTYAEQEEADRMPSMDDPRVIVDKKKIGKEKIDNHPCIKYDAVIYLKDKPDEKYKAVLWEAEDLKGLVIRQEVTLPPGKRGRGEKEKAVSELKDVKLGAANAAMFEIPKGYRKVDNMMEVMGGPGGMEKQMQQMDERMKKKKP